MAWLNDQEVEAMKFAFVGKNVKISSKASFYNCSKIKIGNNSRIDDFCVLSAGEGGIEIGQNIHIAVYTSLIGKGKIILKDFSNISSRVSIYSSNDDYSGSAMTNPTIPDKFKNVTSLDVIIGRHVIVGAGSVILPGVQIDDGAVIGAISLVKGNCKAFGIYAGIPSRWIKDRNKDILEVEKLFLSETAELK